MSEKKNGDGAGRPRTQQKAPNGSVVQVVYHIPENGANAQRSALHEVEFPAKLVLSRWDRRDQKAFACEDTIVLWSDEDLEWRFAQYQAMEEAGAIPYTYRVVEAALAGQAVEEIKADMERMRDWREEQMERQAVRLGVG